MHLVKKNGHIGTTNANSPETARNSSTRRATLTASLAVPGILIVALTLNTTREWLRQTAFPLLAEVVAIHSLDQAEHESMTSLGGPAFYSEPVGRRAKRHTACSEDWAYRFHTVAACERLFEFFVDPGKPLLPLDQFAERASEQGWSITQRATPDG
jgi:hypothetical protein